VTIDDLHGGFANGLEKISKGCHAAWNSFILFFVWLRFCRPLFGMVSELLPLRVDVEGTEMFRCIHEQLRATSVPHLESAFHSHSPSIYIVGTAVINLASKVHLHIHMPKKAGPKETPPPAPAAAPHRTAAISRTEKPIPKRPVSTTTTHTENRSPLPHYFSIRSPNLGRLFALPELSCRFLTLFLSCQGLFPLH
jgi:hypothetical protein